jgi:hypothetical protein
MRLPSALPGHTLPEIDGPPRTTEEWRELGRAHVATSFGLGIRWVGILVAQVAGQLLFTVLLVRTPFRSVAWAGLVTTFVLTGATTLYLFKLEPRRRRERAEVAAVRSIAGRPGTVSWALVAGFFVAFVLAYAAVLLDWFSVEAFFGGMGVAVLVFGLVTGLRQPGRRWPIAAFTLFGLLGLALQVFALRHSMRLMVLVMNWWSLPWFLLWIARRPLLRPVYGALPPAWRSRVLPLVETAVPDVRSLRHEGKTDDALTRAEAHLAAPNPSAVADAMDEIALLLQEKGDLRAIRVAVAAVRLWPNDPRGFRHLARWLSAHDPDRAAVFDEVADVLDARSFGQNGDGLPSTTSSAGAPSER